MRIAQLIGSLEEIRARLGDLDVYVYDDWSDFPLHHFHVEEASEDKPKRLCLSSDSGYAGQRTDVDEGVVIDDSEVTP